MINDFSRDPGDDPNDTYLCTWSSFRTRDDNDLTLHVIKVG